MFPNFTAVSFHGSKLNYLGSLAYRILWKGTPQNPRGNTFDLIGYLASSIRLYCNCNWQDGRVFLSVSTPFFEEKFKI